jgi:hypothetical protein
MSLWRQFSRSIQKKVLINQLDKRQQKYRPARTQAHRRNPNLKLRLANALIGLFCVYENGGLFLK